MADVSLEWEGDFQVDASGDLYVSDGDDEVRQRLSRRLFTNVFGYVWHPEYGAGLPQKIGSTLSVEEIRAVVAAQLSLETSVAPNPPAQLFVNGTADGLISIGIKYVSAISGVTVSFSITG